jgi:hypothetical protein
VAASVEFHSCRGGVKFRVSPSARHVDASLTVISYMTSKMEAVTEVGTLEIPYWFGPECIAKVYKV